MEYENRKVKVTNIYRRTEKARAKTVIHKGGSGSSKTHSLCQFFIFKRLLSRTDKYKLLVLRETRNSCALSVHNTFIEKLQEYGLYSEKRHNKTNLLYKFDNGNMVQFAGLEDQERIKSTEWHDIWVEEANEITKKNYIFLKATRLYRGNLKYLDKNHKCRIFLSYNPVPCWIDDIIGEQDVELIHSTYKDNPFCNDEYIQTLENLKNEDYAYYQIYALGITAAPRGIIYAPYIMESAFPDSFDDTFYGLDFGFNNPSALLRISVKDLKDVYLQEKIYKTGLTNSQLIELMKQEIHEDEWQLPIYADSAEPDRIAEIYNAGFNVIPAEKTVKDGIDFCKRFIYHTLRENINLNSESKSYKWREDKNGNPIDEPVKFKDHLMDGKRYGLYTHYKGVMQQPDFKFI